MSKMMTKHLIDPTGRYIGAFAGSVLHHPAVYADGEPVTITSDDPSQPDVTVPGEQVLVTEAWDEEVWPDMPAEGIEVPAAPQDARQVWDGQAWTWPAGVLLAHLANLRWQRETGGTVIDGMPMATDRDAQAMLTGAAVSAQLEGEAYSLRWKTSAGFITLTGAQVITLARAVGAHVQAAFGAEDTMVDRIQGGEITTMEDLEAAWATI